METAKKAQFRNLPKFKTVEEYQKWIDETTAKVIHLKDNGQDLLTIWVHESGEILDVNCQQSVWTGMFIDMEKLKVGENLIFGSKVMDFIPETITDRKK